MGAACRLRGHPDRLCRRGAADAQAGVRHDRRRAADGGAGPAGGVYRHVPVTGEHAGPAAQAWQGPPGVYRAADAGRAARAERAKKRGNAFRSLEGDAAGLPRKGLHLSVRQRGTRFPAAGRAERNTARGDMAIPDPPHGRGKMRRTIRTGGKTK